MSRAEVERRREGVLLPPVPDRESYFFLEDHCANCLQPLTPWNPKLFCSDWCKDVAKTTRYARRTVTDGRIYDPSVYDAIKIRFAHNMSGGYNPSGRAIPVSVRVQVTARDGGVCVSCGQPANQLDHIDGDDSTPENLQLMCDPCHRTKTRERITEAPPSLHHLWPTWWTLRVQPDSALLLADDQDQCKFICGELKAERKERLKNLPVELQVWPYTEEQDQE